jgi:7-carboxy-7-deazaguanine synthase
MNLKRVLAAVDAYTPRYVTVTGGEPLAQPTCLALLFRLCDAGYQVSLETSGALDVSKVDPRVVLVMDLKTPGSGEGHRNRYENLRCLRPHDQVKFVICDRADYEWSKTQFERFDLGRRCEVLYSANHGKLDAALLADWILADRLPVRFQIQLHKYLWGDVRGR